METNNKTTTFKEENKPSTSSIILNNQTNLILSGVQTVYSTNEKFIILKTNGKKLTITGENISITKLSVDNGELEAKGQFESIKYTQNIKNTIFKKVFK